MVLSGSIYAVMMMALCKVDLGESRGIYYVANYVPRKGGQELHAFRDYRRDSTYQVLVLGSSHAYRGYDPSIFTSEDLSCFNFGTSSQNSLVANHLLDHYIDIHPQQLVIIDVYAGMFEGQGMESILRMVVHEPSSEAAADLVVKSADLRSVNTWVKRMANINEKDEYWAGGYQGSGYTLIPDTLKELKELPGPYSPNPLFFAELEDLIMRIYEAGAEVVLVSHPMPPLPDYDERHAAFLDDLNEVVEATGVPHIDRTFDDGYEFWHFADENHLNQAGVDIFNPVLIEDLRQLNLID